MLTKNILRQIDVQDMMVFITVMARGTSKVAAEYLGVSESTISYCLKRLRTCFDDDLFIVKSGVMEPTPKAKAIGPYIKAAIDSINQCAAPVSKLLAENQMRTFRIQAPEYFELLLMPYVVSAIAAKFHVSLALERLGSELPVERLLAGKVDLVFGFGPGYHRVHPELEWQSILDEDFVCLTSIGTLRNQQLTLEQFLSHQHVHPTPWDATTNMVDSWLASIERERQVIASATTYQGCINIIERTPLIFSLPKRLLPLLRVPDVLRICEPPIGFPKFTLDILWSRRRSSDSQWLRDELGRLFRSVLIRNPIARSGGLIRQEF